MESSISIELQEISRRIEVLTAQRDEARASLEHAQDEITGLKSLVSELQTELKKKELDVEFLTVSHKLADTPQSLADARSTLKKLIARVDRAIGMLREDAGI